MRGRAVPEESRGAEPVLVPADASTQPELIRVELSDPSRHRLGLTGEEHVQDCE